MGSSYDEIQQSVAHIRSHSDFAPDVGIVLGSGLGPLADEIETVCRFPYAELPHFPRSTAPGHEGNLILGRLEGKNVVAYKAGFISTKAIQLSNWYFRCGWVSSWELRRSFPGRCRKSQSVDRGEGEKDNTVPRAIAHASFKLPDQVGHGEYLPLVGDFMSFNEIADTLNRQGHHFSFHQIPRDGFRTEVADTFGYFEAHTYLGPDSSDRIALANRTAGRQPTTFAAWARANVPVQAP